MFRYRLHTTIPAARYGRDGHIRVPTHTYRVNVAAAEPAAQVSRTRVHFIYYVSVLVIDVLVPVTLRSCDDCARTRDPPARPGPAGRVGRRRPAPTTAHTRDCGAPCTPRHIHMLSSATETRCTVPNLRDSRGPVVFRDRMHTLYYVVRDIPRGGRDRVSRSLTFVADVRDAHSGPLIAAATDRARRARGMLATRASSGSATRTHICSPPPCTRAARAMRRS